MTGIKGGSMGSNRFAAVIIGIFVLFAIPYVTTCIVQGKNNQKQQNIKSVKSGMNVCISDGEEYELIDVEEYIVYALAGKADITWNDEMLKTMAVVFRTSIYYEMEHQLVTGSEKGRNIINEEDLYEIRYSKSELKEKLGSDYNRFMERVYDAVLLTGGQTITYQGECIMPVYHSISIGHTISANELYGVDIPYLRNVDSSADIEAENFIETVIYSENRIKKEFQEKGFLDIWQEEISDENAEQNQKSDGEAEYPENEFKIVEATESGFAKKINVFGQVVDGKTFSKVLNLSSTNVHIDEVDSGYRVIAIGRGNSMGLSLYGATAFAQNGMTYDEIIDYYYTDVEISNFK